MGSNTATVMTLANSIIGVGVLAMPFCFKQCGIVLSIMMLILSSYLSRTACHFLLKAAIMARRRNFEFLAFHTFGPHGKTIVELFIIGFLMGTCIAFFVVVGDLGPAIIAKLFQIENTASLRQLVLVGLAAGIVLPLGLMRNVTSLSTICTATIGFYLCLVIKVMSEAMPHLAANDWIGEVHLWRPSGLLQCTPIFSMALFCQTQLFEIYESMPNATLERMNDVIRHAVNLCTGFYIFVGFFGYVAFYTQSFTGNILMSFTPSWVSDAIKMGFVLSVAVSFPLVIFPCRASLYSLLFRRVHMSHHEGIGSHIPETRFRFLTFGIISVALVVGLITPNIELVLGLVGSTIGVLICVMFPAVAFICISTKISKERLLAQVLLFVGVLILVLGTYATVYPTQEIEISGVETNTLPPDRIDSIARMSLLPVENNVPNKADNTKIVEKTGVILPESVKDLPSLNVNAVEKQPPPKIQEVELPKIPEVEKKPDVRQEPPVPVEPPGDIPAAVPSSLPDKKEEKSDNVIPKEQQTNDQIEEAAHSNNAIKKDVADLEVKKDITNAEKIEKDKSNNEQVNQDAIKKEDEELAEAEKQAQSDEKKEDEALLKKLEKHKEEQKKLLQEQKQILEELKEHKKELDEAAAKKKSDDDVVPLDTKDDSAMKVDNKNKSGLLKIDQPRLIDSKLPELNNLISDSGNLQKNPIEKNLKKDNVINEVNKPISGDVLEKTKNKNNNLENLADVKNPSKDDGVARNKVVKNYKNLTLHDLKVISENILSSKTLKMENEKTKSIGNPNAQGLDSQKTLKEEQPLPKSQENPIPLPKKLPLPFPLALRNMTSEFYRQQSVDLGNKPEANLPSDPKANSKGNESPGPAGDAKVMRREILAEDKIGLVANVSKGVKITPEVEMAGKNKQRDILSSVGNDNIYDEAKNEAHNRQKRDAMLEEALLDTESILLSGIKANNDHKNEIHDKQEKETVENCGIHDKDNTVKHTESDNRDKSSKTMQENHELLKEDNVPSDDNNNKKQEILLNIQTADKNVANSSNSVSQIGGDNSSMVASGTDVKRIDPVKTVQILNELKENPSVVTLSSLIKTVSIVSEPKFSDTDIKHLNEAVADIKDSSAVPRPMSRDLKSVSNSPQFTDENEEKEKNT
ncbi:hypothetical protein C0J52_00653 [Blattella germanica]|nr:hypothetical protein C0J52_00653 [Blattella germanica]